MKDQAKDVSIDYEVEENAGRSLGRHADLRLRGPGEGGGVLYLGKL